jgi:hypothetical protein
VLGELAFLLVMAVGTLISLTFINVYEQCLARDASGSGVDRGLTEFLNGISRLLALVALLLVALVQ